RAPGLWRGDSRLLTAPGDAPGHPPSSQYDTADRRSSLTDAKGNTTQYSFDEQDNVITTVRIELSDLGAPAQSFTDTFTYDSLDRQRTHTDGVGNAWTFLYDSRGNRTRATDPLGHSTRYVYDGLDRLVPT